MKNLANVMAVLILIIAMGLMVGCGCGTTSEMSTDDMVDQTTPETIPPAGETVSPDTSLPDVIEGTEAAPVPETEHRYDENGNLIDNDGNIIEDAGNAVGDVIEDAGEATSDVMEGVGDGVKDITDGNEGEDNTTSNNGRSR